MAGVAFEDYVHAKMILIWGANPKASNIHLVPFLKEAKRNGAGVRSSSPSATGRSRAEQDAVVRRLREKFGAEIRTVIDHKEKR